MMPTRMLGRRPAVDDPRVPHLYSVMRADEPPPDAVWWAAVGDWPMLGNDRYGDCVEAAALHRVAQVCAYTNRTAPAFTDDDAARLYSEWAGFDPADPSTDRGTVMADAMAKWARDGIACGDAVDVLSSYARVNVRDPAWIRRAVWRFGGLLVGLRCPVEWLDADYMLGAPTRNGFAGEHCVYLAGYETTAAGVEYDVVTWGARFRTTEDTLSAVIDEAWCAMSADWFVDGRDPAGVAWNDVETAMARIRASA